MNNKKEILAAVSELLGQLFEQEEPKNSNEPEPVELLTIKECTEEIRGLNEYTVRQLVARNEIPFIRSGRGKRGKILIPKAALLKYFGGK